MSDTNAQEPTMEEILASIRRIISEDDAPAPKIETPAPAPAHNVLEAAMPPGQAPAPVQPVQVFTAPAPPSPPPPEDDVLELTDPLAMEPEPRYEPAPPVYRAPAFEPIGDLDFSAPNSGPPSYTHHEPLVGDPAADAAASHFGQLSRTIAAPADGRTLEDIVVAVLRPLLKDWLDRYLPQIVESKVQAEVERISRSNVR